MDRPPSGSNLMFDKHINTILDIIAIYNENIDVSLWVTNLILT